MAALNILFKWDGSNIGNIDHLIKQHEIIEDRIVLTFINGEKAFVNRYDNAIPLIADELKPIFGLTKIGRHQCTIAAEGPIGIKRQAIISQIIGKEYPFSTSKEMSKENILNTPDVQCYLQKSYLYRWALGFTRNSDSALWVRTYNSGVTVITSYREIKVDYENEKVQGAKMSAKSVKSWFHGWEKVDELTQTLFSDKNLTQLRFDIENVVRRIDSNYIWWGLRIISRIQSRL